MLCLCLITSNLCSIDLDNIQLISVIKPVLRRFFLVVFNNVNSKRIENFSFLEGKNSKVEVLSREMGMETPLGKILWIVGKLSRNSDSVKTVLFRLISLLKQCLK